MKKIVLLLFVSICACNSGGNSSNTESNTVYIDSTKLPKPDKWIIDNDPSQFTFSSSTNINVTPVDPKINTLLVNFYSDSNCQNPIGHSVSVDTSYNSYISYVANSIHSFSGWNIMFCGNFNGIPQTVGDADRSCLDEFNQTNSISYGFVYSEYDTNGNPIHSNYCKVGRLANTNNANTPCTNADNNNCAYPQSGNFVDYITVPFDYAIWWKSCQFASYDIDSSGQYWRLNALCRDPNYIYHKSTLCYGDTSALNGNCASNYADPNYTSTCLVDPNSPQGKTVVNSNGHLLCGA